MSMFTYTVTVAPAGKHLFRVEGVETVEKVREIVAGFVVVWGKDAIHVAKWTNPVGERISIDTVLPAEPVDVDSRNVRQVERISHGRVLFHFNDGSGVMTNSDYIIIASLTGNGVELWQQSAVEQWAIKQGLVPVTTL